MSAAAALLTALPKPRLVAKRTYLKRMEIGRNGSRGQERGREWKEA